MWHALQVMSHLYTDYRNTIVRAKGEMSLAPYVTPEKDVQWPNIVWTHIGYFRLNISDRKAGSID